MLSKPSRRAPAACLVAAAVSVSASGVHAAAPGHVTEQVLHSFGASATDGTAPVGGLTFGPHGQLYGTTAQGGPSKAGIFFSLSQTGAYTQLYAFDPANGTDGPQQDSPLSLGNDGNLYGTNEGPAVPPYANRGTVYQMTPTGVETVLHDFSGTPDGAVPLGNGLVEGGDGNFYGTTTSGGTHNAGTFYRVTPTGTLTVLYSFQGGNDGRFPSGTPLRGPDGNFWGTTTHGGSLADVGSVYRITPAGEETMIHAFTGASGDALAPTGGLTQGSDGSFWGVSTYGGAQGTGTIFNVTPAGVVTIRYSFGGLGPGHPDAKDGGYPNGPLILGHDGRFYGVTQFGGAHTSGTGFYGDGVIYSYGASGEQVLYSFGANTGDGTYPAGALVEVGPGTFYGTTATGGAHGGGTAFKATVAAGRASE